MLTERILDMVKRFKTIKKKHLLCLLNNCSTSREIERTLKKLISTRRLYKEYYSSYNNRNANEQYLCKNRPLQVPYWVKKSYPHKLIVEEIAFNLELLGGNVVCEEYLDNSKVRCDIMSDGKFYEVELSPRSKNKIREKLNEYDLLGELNNVIFIFKNQELADRYLEIHNVNYKLLYELTLDKKTILL